MENWKVFAKITMVIIIIGVIGLIIFAIFGFPLLNTIDPIHFGFDDVLLAELAIFGTVVFSYWIWTKILRNVKQRKRN